MTAPKTPRSAEEVAQEMVVDAGWLRLGTDGVRLASDVSVPHARDIIARAITLAREDGAAAERARQQPADVALCPAPDVPGQWIAHHVTRDLVTQGDSEPHALRMLAEAIEMMDGTPAQPRDLAGRIRETLQRMMPAPTRSRDDFGRTVWESVAVGAVDRLRIGMCWTHDEAAAKRAEAIERMVQAIVRESGER